MTRFYINRKEVDAKTYSEYLAEFGVLYEPIIHVHRQQEIKPETWPMILLPLKLLAKPGDRGAGDIIARTIGPIGGDKFKRWYKATFGRDCGCGNRQEALNRRWPL